MTEVAAGIIFREDGCVLAARRGSGRRNAHLWEFPGGKREAGEDILSCLRRELMEELSLPVTGLQVVCEAEEGGLRFVFITGRTDAEPVATEHEDLRFLRPRTLLSLPFCPADAPVARALALADPPVTACVWDFDGTLADTYPGLVCRLQAAAARFDLRLDEHRALNLMKNSLSYAAETLCAEKGIDLKAFEAAWQGTKAMVSLRLTPAVEGIPGAVRALSERGCRHFLYTHNDRKCLDFLDEQGLLPFFTDCITREDGYPRKPRPDALTALIRRHGLDPAACVMIGDRPLDVEAGQAAGMLGCLLDTEGRFPQVPADLRAGSAAELAELICPTGWDGLRTLPPEFV
ncbi:MAG: HAD-IA family hydrolase [Clostridia bacterium]|nr:HAD-IA family hydrolase [Clostridia bacterium]